MNTHPRPNHELRIKKGMNLVRRSVFELVLNLIPEESEDVAFESRFAHVGDVRVSPSRMKQRIVGGSVDPS